MHLNYTSAQRERFWSYVDTSGGLDACWLWLKHRNRKGYGQVHFAGGMHSAHRIAWVLTRGDIPEGVCVLHNCPGPAGDNSSCVNPAHLWLGTHEDNVADREAKGRTARGDRGSGHIYRSQIRRRRGEDHPNAKLTAVDVQAMRNLYAQGARVAEIARAFKVTGANASYIVRGKTWVTRPAPAPALARAMSPTAAERFWATLVRTADAGGCWLWPLGHNADGYGTRYFAGRVWTTHRLAWTLAHGAIPPDLNVLHVCHVRVCCNPGHLRLGTQKENVADTLASGRHSSQIYRGIWPTGDRSFFRTHPEVVRRGDDHYTRRTPEKVRRGSAHVCAKLTEADVGAIRERCAQGEMQKHLAAEYGVSRTIISYVVNRKSWRHVD